MLGNREQGEGRRCGLFFFEKLLYIFMKAEPMYRKQYLLPATYYFLSKNKENPCFT